MELRPGLHRIQAPLGERFVALHLLVGSESALLFDTGITESVTETLLPYLESIGLPLERLRWVISSHCDFDHTGGNAALLAAAPHVELLAGAADVPLTEDLQTLIDERYGEFRETDGFDDPPETTAYIREVSALAPVTGDLLGGESFSLGDREVLVLHSPGHSKGHLALWDASNRALLIADATLGETVPTADGRPAFPPTYRDAQPYLDSIELFRGHDAELLLTAHYPVFEGEAVAGFLDASAAYVERLDEAVLGALAGGAALTTLDLIRSIADEVGDWSPEAAEYLIFPVTGNLERLVARGLVAESRATLPRTWQRVSA